MAPAAAWWRCALAAVLVALLLPGVATAAPLGPDGSGVAGTNAARASAGVVHGIAARPERRDPRVRRAHRVAPDRPVRHRPARIARSRTAPARSVGVRPLLAAPGPLVPGPMPGVGKPFERAIRVPLGRVEPPASPPPR